MALRYSTNNIHAKLDDLSLDSLPEPPVEQRSPKQEAFTTKSLLSKSLAGEKLRPGMAPPPQVFMALDDLTDEHPEPELLATSVGKDLDGRLIPSSSTISLLSLSNNAVPAHQDVYVGKQPAVPERVNSYTNIRSRNSLTHFTQQRLQPYQKLTSPTMPTGEFSITSPQSIPFSRTHSHSQIAPDSPNLDPTSLGGSPSRFWLSSQTPPRSLSNSFKARGQFQLTPLAETADPAGELQHSSAGSKNSVSQAINIRQSGNDSPVLNPVQTPLEDLPMTPLYLNSESDHYFVLTNHTQARHHHFSSDIAGQNIDEIEEEQDDYMGE